MSPQKLLFLILFFLLSLPVAQAQNTELSVHLNSGLFSFGGESAEASSFIIVSDVANLGNYTNNPYGSKEKLSYGVSAQIQRITSKNLIFALSSGYEVLRSKVEINNLSGEFLELPELVTGQTIFENSFITLFSGAGRRFTINNLDLDLMVGPEIGFNTASKEKGEANTNSGITVTTNRERSKHDTDVRLRTSLAVYYNNLGATAGYSYGLTNYSGNLIGANRERYSRYIQFGLIYRIR